MNKDELLALLHDFKMAKKDLEENLLELTVIAHAIETEICKGEVTTPPVALSVALQSDIQSLMATHKNQIVSQLYERANASVATAETSEENVNESHETAEPTISLAESFRSQLAEQEEESELDVEDFDEEYENEEHYDEHDEEYAEEEVVEQEGALSPLAQTLRNQINEAELASLPTFDGDTDGDIVSTPISTSDTPNLSDVLREQAEKPSLVEQLRKQMVVPATEESIAISTEVDTDNNPALTMAQMIEQLRNDIKNTTDTEDKEKEEELVVATAASSDNNVAASLRKQLLVQELKKQLR